MGNLLSVVVHAANTHDTKAGIFPARQAVKRYPTIEGFCGDAGYRGTFVLDVNKRPGLGVDIAEKIKPREWEKLPWRWVVERTFAWLGNSRRLSKDYEITTSSSETVAKISHAHTLLRFRTR